MTVWSQHKIRQGEQRCFIAASLCKVGLLTTIVVYLSNILMWDPIIAIHEGTFTVLSITNAYKQENGQWSTSTSTLLQRNSTIMSKWKAFHHGQCCSNGMKWITPLTLHLWHINVLHESDVIVCLFISVLIVYQNSFNLITICIHFNSFEILIEILHH